MKRNYFLLAIAATGFLFTSCNNDDKTTDTRKADSTAKAAFKEENITYEGDGVSMNGFIVYDSNNKDKRPVVLVVHEWWGLNDYSKKRARDLAQLGYIAMAVDIYGDGKQAEDPGSAGKLAEPFYKDHAKAKARFDAAVARIKSYSQADTSKIAAIGYCFGGGLLLNAARLGEDIDGVVSFHGSLQGTPAVKDLLKASILVCHGGADSFVPRAEVDQFKKQMDSIGAKMTFKEYEGATHAFTNPDADVKAKKYNMPIAYHPAADSSSWADMKDFLNVLFR